MSIMHSPAPAVHCNPAPAALAWPAWTDLSRWSIVPSTADCAAVAECDAADLPHSATYDEPHPDLDEEGVTLEMCEAWAAMQADDADLDGFAEYDAYADSPAGRDEREMADFNARRPGFCPE